MNKDRNHIDLILTPTPPGVPREIVQELDAPRGQDHVQKTFANCIAAMGSAAHELRLQKKGG